MVGIYKITSPTGKVYIGQSWEIERRWYRHKRKYIYFANFALYNSFSKHGIDSHNFSVIHELPKDVSQEVMDTYELLYWQQHIDCGFEMLNIRKPGNNHLLSDEAKEKIRVKRIGGIGHNKGKKFSEEHKRKISEAHKGKIRTTEHSLNISKAKKGKRLSEETKKKMGDAHRGKKYNKK